MFRCALTLLVACTLALAATVETFAQADESDWISQSMMPAVMKIEVTGRSVKLDASGNNICTSEGTGFLVSADILLTAYHVVDVDPSCDPVIVVSSRTFQVETIAKQIGHQGDVVALRLDPASGLDRLCALVVGTSDVFNTKGVRFAIPASLKDPIPLKIEFQGQGEFNPHVLFSPTNVHGGDSGGPIVHMFKVVGMTKEKLSSLAGYGIMMPTSAIRLVMSLIAENFKPTKFCNPLTFGSSFEGVKVEYKASLAVTKIVNTIISEEVKTLEGMKFNTPSTREAIAPSGRWLGVPKTMVAPPPGDIFGRPLNGSLTGLILRRADAGGLVSKTIPEIRNAPVPRPVDDGLFIPIDRMDPNQQQLNKEIADYLKDRTEEKIWSGYVDTLK